MLRRKNRSGRVAGAMRALFMHALEPRVLLAAPVDDLKHGPLGKLDASLSAAWVDFNAHVAAGRAADTFTSPNRLLHEADGRVAIEAYTTGDATALERELRALQMIGVQRFGNSVAGMLPYGKLAALAAAKSLSFARPIAVATRAGSVMSQGDASLRADLARNTYGVTGSGVKVGVLSDSFDKGPGSYAADVASGDLPAGVQILSEPTSGSDEGRAMAQLIYDSAPGSSLAFATAFAGMSSFASNILALRDAGSKVIVDDVIYFAEPMFQDGVIAQAVDNVVGTGSAYFSAAGNDGRQAYQSAFRPGLTRASGSISGGGPKKFWGGLTHDFDPGPGVDDMQSFTLGPNQAITLSFQWDQPYGTIPGSASCANDVDIYIVNAAGTQVVAAAATTNAGAGRDPIELLSFTNGASTTTYNLIIARFSGDSPGLIKYVNFDTHNFTEHNTNSGALYGHSNASGAAATGASAWFNTPAYGVDPPVINSYSSRGPTPILFSTNGTRLGSAVTRVQPKFVAPDGGNTTFFFSDHPSDEDTIPNFFGTSAAAPAAAAVAALLLQAKPTLTPAQIYSTLQTTALDMDDPLTGGFDAGFDDATGFGFVRADAAVASVLPGSISGVAFHDLNGNGTAQGGEPGIAGATVFIDANSNGLHDGGELSAVTSGSGSYTIAGVANGSHTVRQVAPAGFVVTTVNNVNVSGATSNVNFANIATHYIGTGGADDYLVRRKSGDISHEIVIGGVVTYVIPAVVTAGLSFDLAGGADTFAVDAINGAALPVGGVSVTGGAGDDEVVVLGTSAAENATFAAGAITFGGSVSHSGVETVSFDGEGGFDTVAINAGAVLLPANQQFQSLSIGNGASATLSAGGNKMIITRALSLSGSAKLDLRDNDLALDYTGGSLVGSWNGSAYTGATGWIAAGRNGGAWDGDGIVTSEPQASSGSARTTLAVAEASAMLDINGSDTALWNGQTVDATTVLVKYTYAGDLDLDGDVDGDDYFSIDSHVAQSGTVFGYALGDIDFDGDIDGDDYFWIDSNVEADGVVL